MKAFLNTSFHVVNSRADELADWLKANYLPAARQSGLFSDVVLARILTTVHDDITAFAAQLTFDPADIEAVERWHDSEAAQIKSALTSLMAQDAVYFSTFMCEVD